MDEPKRIEQLSACYLLAMIPVSLVLSEWIANRSVAALEWLLYAFICEVFLCLFGSLIFLVLGMIVSLFNGHSEESRLLIGIGAKLGMLFFLTSIITSAVHKDDDG